MRSGRMDRELTLRRKTISENGYGERVETWITIATVWAEKIPLRGAERHAAQQTMANVDVRFKIHYRTDITPLNRGICEGIEYDFQGVLEIGRKQGLEILASGRAD